MKLALLFLINLSLFLSTFSYVIPQPDEAKWTEELTNCVNARVANLKHKKADLKVASSLKLINKIYKAAERICLPEELVRKDNEKFEEILKMFKDISSRDFKEIEGCLSLYILKSNTTGMLIDGIDRNLASSLTDDDCKDDWENFKDLFKSLHVVNDECHADDFNLYLLRVLLLSNSEYSAAVVEDERKIFVKNIKKHLNSLVDCWIDSANTELLRE